MGFFLKISFFETVEAKVIILTRYVKPDETMAINKFQRSRLTFNFSAKFAHIGVPLKHNFLRNPRPFELIFHMKTPYDRLAKIYTNCTGYMTKMATTPIHGKNPLNIFFSRTKR